MDVSTAVPPGLQDFAVSLMLDGSWGRECREAHLLQKKAEARSVGYIWDQSPAFEKRKAIYSALRIDPAESLAYYVTHPFRIVEYDGGHWIGGAVGAPSLKDPIRAAAWTPLDVSDLVLWNPRTGALRVAGEPKDFLLAPGRAETITVYGEGYAFFRAWADWRAETWPSAMDTPELPGALLIGDIDKAQWRSLEASTLRAGPGIDAARLKSAAFRQAHVQRVTEA